MLRGVILGILVGFLLVFLGVYYYFASGKAPVTTKSPEMPFEHKFAHMAQHAYMEKQPHLQPPIPEDEKTFLEGSKVYKDHCAVCHGLPGQPKTMIAEGMFPPPPQLFRGTGVTDDESWETYWTVFGGIRMTGMPGFSEQLGETKIWQVSLLLKNADKLSPTVLSALTSTETLSSPAATAPPAATTPPPAAASPNPAAPATTH